MKKVTGIGGIFFKSDNPAQMSAWYEQHLGIVPQSEGMAIFEWREKDEPQTIGQTILSHFPSDTDYFAPSKSSFMLNFRVDNLDALLEQLRAEGVTVDDKVEDSEYGKFGWIMDPEGNRIELWQPPNE